MLPQKRDSSVFITEKQCLITLHVSCVDSVIKQESKEEENTESQHRTQPQTNWITYFQSESSILKRKMNKNTIDKFMA